MSEFAFCTREHIAEYVNNCKEELSEKIKECIRKGYARPRLMIIQVGDNPASNKYVANKLNDCREVQIEATHMKFPENVTYEELVDFILAERDSYHGLMVQMPTNESINSRYEDLMEYIYAFSDVDGFRKDSMFTSCTPKGLIDYIEYSKGKKWFVGKHAVVIGRSNIVGKPMASLLLNNDCTVTICHSKTRHLKAVCKNADIIISAVGKANLVDKSFVKNSKTCVFNIGFDFTPEGKMVGDVDVQSVKEVTQWCTPVVGSSGVLTRLALLQNVYQAYVMQEEVDI